MALCGHQFGSASYALGCCLCYALLTDTLVLLCLGDELLNESIDIGFVPQVRNAAADRLREPSCRDLGEDPRAATGEFLRLDLTER